MNLASVQPADSLRPEPPRVFGFGSPELAALHEAAWEDAGPTRTPAGFTWGGTGWNYHYSHSRARVIKWAYDGFRYIVDHGSFRTLNTMRAGQHAVQMEEI